MIDSRIQQLGAGAIWECITGPCDFFRLNTASSLVEVEFMRNGSPVQGRMARFLSGMHCTVQGGYDAVRLRTAAAQELEVIFGDGECGADRLDGSVDLALGVLLENEAEVTVGVAAVVINGPDSDLRELRIKAPFGNAASVFIGGAGLTLANACIELLPGDLWIEKAAPAAEVWAISGTAAQKLRLQGVK